ncbi:hypothetical protein ACWGSE_26450 [Streptomyces diastaticus]|uniref:hypothetical protein n=1 Tax=Streptomyces TaxID=1883 RepID=UPI000C25B344|nr:MULTISPECIES: hypothetical protein [unclassified Streptomyces]MBL3806604.1 hypothetical protein [Streptomyces sp. BRB081]PJM80537.1 hypothetical protein CH313_27945 [Streptomyces sp. TSRI0384-2]RPK79443.1 hypothetical protein EES47_29475 [Streptomyces sp. ADI98-12]
MASPLEPLAFRTVLHTSHRTALDAVRRVTSRWLAEKHPSQEIPLGTGRHRLTESSVLLTQIAYDTEGAELATRLQLREDRPEATWRTTVTATRTLTGRHATVLLDLECFAVPGFSPRPGKPRLVGQMVSELSPHDGLSRITCHPLKVTADSIGSLLDVLCDPDRRRPVVVAAPLARPDHAWSKRMQHTVTQCTGDASVYLLADLAAVDAFRDAAGSHHRVGPGAVRVFGPEVDPAWPPDAARHRVIGGQRFTDPGSHAWRALYRQVQASALEIAPPAAIRALVFPDPGEAAKEERRHSLAKARSVAKVPAARHNTGSVDRETELRAEITVLNGLLEEADAELSETKKSAVLSSQLQTATSEKLQEATASLHEEMEDHLATLDALHRARTEADRLRTLVIRQGQYLEAAQAADDLPTIPSSFEELADRLDRLPRVKVTADTDVMLSLDEHGPSRTWAARTWAALLALDSYAAHALDGWSGGGFREFCMRPPSGAHTISANQVAIRESAATMEKYGHERLFPGARGELVEMQAHLRLGTSGRIAPRCHFQDDVKGAQASRRIVVGYIGPHLSNTLTSNI